jgi:hypothetical protein
MSNNKDFYGNGINAETGDYLVKPMDFKELARYALDEGEKPKTSVVNWMKAIWEKIHIGTLGLPVWADENDLADTGWGIIFHAQEDAAVKKAFEPLINHRLNQVGNPKKVKVLDYHDGEEYLDWLARHGGAPGDIDPEKMPYYLLIVGSPERIPYLFGFHLDFEYAVGRVDFDQVKEYEQYVASLIEYENADILPAGKEAVIFSTRHNFDRATMLSNDELSAVLAGQPGAPGVAEEAGYTSRSYLAESARKENLTQIFSRPGGGKPPSFLFTASHGIGWPNPVTAEDIKRQKDSQGALLCQDWPGGPTTPAQYFSAADLPVDANLQGMISFHFACFSAGTPRYDRFIHKRDEPPPQLANQAFIAALPKALLAHGCLASIGHVERAWGYSIAPAAGDPNIQIFKDVITGILKGFRLGLVMRGFNERYGSYNIKLNADTEKIQTFNMQVPDEVLARDWVQRNDAEGYVIVGDPAVRLRIEKLT